MRRRESCLNDEGEHEAAEHEERGDQALEGPHRRQRRVREGPRRHAHLDALVPEDELPRQLPRCRHLHRQGHLQQRPRVYSPHLRRQRPGPGGLAR